MRTKASGLLIIFSLAAVMANAQVIQSASPITLPAPPATTQTITSGQSLSVYSNSSVTLNPGFSAQLGSTLQVGLLTTTIYPVPPASANTNPELNWVLTRAFDQSGNLIKERKNFFDLSGKALQEQMKSYSSFHVLASQSLYDQYGRAAIQTLKAPINSSTFIYKPDFVRNGSGAAYNTSNFDVSGKLNAPDAVDATQQGTLGWYYSNNNTWDKFVPATAYPYSRKDFFNDGTNDVARSAGIGDELRMGKGREVVSSTFPVLQELSFYLSVRNKFFSDATVGQTGQSGLTGGVVQKAGRDQQGNWGMNVLDKNGSVLMSALPGTWLTLNNSITLNNYKEEYDINYNTLNVPLKQIKLTGAGHLLVYQNGTPSYQPSVSGYAVPDITSGNFRFLSDKPFTISYLSQNTSTTQAVVCDNCRSVVQSGSVDGQNYHYLNLPQGGTLGITGGTVQILDLVTNAILYPNQSAAVNLSAGMYKVISVSGTPQISYTTKWGDIGYNFYDQKGQMIATVSPNGVQQLINNGIAAYADKNAIPFVILYEYDQQGRLLAIDDKSDRGRSEFIYRRDGKLRFSQNAEQRTTGRFSYTNYDDSGRPVESGEYLPGDITFTAAKTNLALLENITSTGGLTGGTKTDWIRTHYDMADNSHGQSGYTQEYLEGAVSWTENVNSKTWYSYDQEGKVVWVIKWINGLGYKTLDYTYDYFNNITTILFQKNVSSEKFYHHYSYDVDQRLSNVQTSRDGINKLQHANYQYYLHGPIKRVELGDQLQGIDYVYTAEGLLKSMNHASAQNSKDPGGDGNNSFASDAFGMQIEYYPNDYNRAGSNISSISTGQPSYYNGNVTGMSWQSQKPASVVSLMGSAIQNPTMYTYTYDNKYQLSAAAWGTPDFTANNFAPATQFAEKNITYDANGNITGLQRTNSSGTLSDDFSKFQFAPGSNKLVSVGNTTNPTAYASFTYNNRGQIKSENKAGTSFGYFLKYDVLGKVTGIYADAALTQLKVGYGYDEGGHRISRTDNTGSSPVTTYYVYDLAGNVIAVYVGSTLNELPVYGSGRLGTYMPGINSYVYELKDKTGSVRVVINRNKNSNGQADIYTYNDYYPYGGVARAGGTGYRYEYQGAYAEKDPVTSFNNFDLRMYDGRIGRWLTTDPKQQYISPYKAMGNNPVNGKDVSGGFWQEFKNWVTGNGWISDKGVNFMKTHAAATLLDWTGDRKIGYATVSYASAMMSVGAFGLAVGPQAEISLTRFPAIQDYTFNGIDYTFDYTLEYSAGIRASMLVKGLEGFDINLGSVKLLTYSWANNKWEHISSDKVEVSEGFSVDHEGIGFGGELSMTIEKGNATSLKLQGNLDIGLKTLKANYDVVQAKFNEEVGVEFNMGVGLVISGALKLVVEQHDGFHR